MNADILRSLVRIRLVGVFLIFIMFCTSYDSARGKQKAERYKHSSVGITEDCSVNADMSFPVRTAIS